MLVLSEAEVRELLPTADLVDVMEQALAAFSSGQVNQPVRTTLEVGSDRAYFGVMPACLPAHKITRSHQCVFRLSQAD